MRSIPPASSHFAESPVPAPPPMIGSRRRILSRSFARMSWRGMRGMGEARLSALGTAARFRARDLGKGGDRRLGKFGIVDVVRETLQAPVRRGTEAAGDRIEER